MGKGAVDDPRRSRLRARMLAALLIGGTLCPGFASAQDPADAAVSPESPVSPGGAFLRSVLVPGWGHMATGAYARGGFYVAAQSGSLWMLWKSVDRRSQAVAFQRSERTIAVGRLAPAFPDPDALRIAVEDDPAVRAGDELVEARGQQVEDWIAASVFILLLGAADAFVSAHLMDFPEPLSLDVLPGGPGRGLELRLALPVGSGAGGGR